MRSLFFTSVMRHTSGRGKETFSDLTTLVLPRCSMPAADLTLRRYTPADENATIELWRRSWQAAYPSIDFSARVEWWRQRWRNELIPLAQILVAEADGVMTGFVTVDPRTRYLDQLVVAPEAWGSQAAAALVTEAKRLSPTGLDLHVNQDNARAIRFYEKHGFAIAGNDINPTSGRPTYKMSWKPI